MTEKEKKEREDIEMEKWAKKISIASKTPKRTIEEEREMREAVKYV